MSLTVLSALGTLSPLFGCLVQLQCEKALALSEGILFCPV